MWWHDFARKTAGSPPRSEFEGDLCAYFAAAGGVDVAQLKRFDFAPAPVKLVYSTPGYHSGEAMRRNGHMRLRHLLESVSLPAAAQAPVLCVQCSSLGALDESWFATDFCRSLSVSLDKPRGEPTLMQLIWPTVENVRNSLAGAHLCACDVCTDVKRQANAFDSGCWCSSHAGYASGGSIPFDKKNYRPFLDKVRRCSVSMCCVCMPAPGV